MPSMNLSLSEEKRRDFILNGHLSQVLLALTVPLALYGFFNYLYGFFDMIMVSYIGSDELASVVFIDEIKNAILAFGGGIAAAGTVIVAKSYGAGNLEEARKNAASAFSLALIVSLFVALLTVLFGKQALGWLNAPEEIIQIGLDYYDIQMVSTILMAVNSVYFGFEKAKGNTTVILLVNVLAMAVKLILSAIFVYGMGKGIESVAFATLIAQGVLTIVALGVMFGKKNSLQLRWNALKPDRAFLLPILLLSLPVFSGKFMFSFGKVLVNSMAAFYGPLAIAAFGLAMKFNGWAGSIANVFEESETGIIGQNLGAKKLKRAMDTGKKAQFFSLIVCIVGTIFTVLSIDWIVGLFISEENSALRTMAVDIYVWERWSVITSALIVIVSGFFVGFKMSKISFFLNILRIFIFRIPTLWILIRLGVGYVALGYTMFLSNTLTCLAGEIIFFFFLRKVKNYGYMDLRLPDASAKTV
jgi:putative MATE family efflux protein